MAGIGCYTRTGTGGSGYTRVDYAHPIETTGILKSWCIDSPFANPTKLKVFRYVQNPNGSVTIKFIGESALINVPAGISTNPCYIRVNAGDWIGIYSNPGTSQGLTSTYPSQTGRTYSPGGDVTFDTNIGSWGIDKSVPSISSFVAPLVVNPQIFNVCWGEGLGSPCAVPPSQPTLVPGQTVNLITDIANSGDPTTIRAIIKAEGVVIFDNTRLMDPYPAGGLWSVSVPYTVPNKNIAFVAEVYGWDNSTYVLTDTQTLTIPVATTTAEYHIGDYHNLITGVGLATINPEQSSFGYGTYPMGNPLDPSYCATLPNKSLDQSKSTFVAVLLNLFNVYISGRVTFNWYRNRDNKLLGTSIIDIPNPANWGYTRWDWYSNWSWICKLPGGIEEPGAYHVDIYSDPYGFFNSIPFTIECSTPVCNLYVA